MVFLFMMIGMMICPIQDPTTELMFSDFATLVYTNVLIWFVIAVYRGITKDSDRLLEIGEQGFNSNTLEYCTILSVNNFTLGTYYYVQYTSGRREYVLTKLINSCSYAN